MTRQIQKQSGLTLVEACTVMTVIVVLAAIAAPGMQDLIDARRLEGTAAQLATDLQFVRSEAVSRNEPMRLSLHTVNDGSCYVIHSGAANACDCNASGAAICHGDAVAVRSVHVADVDHVALRANVSSMLFDPQHGTVSPSGTLNVIGSHGRAVHHIVNVMGRVHSCSPSGLMAAYRAC